MKKLERIKLAKLSEEFSPMSLEQSMRIKGGGYTDPTTDCTFHSSSEVSSAIENGSWDGGWIAGVGYVGADTSLDEFSNLDLTSEMGSSDIQNTFDSIFNETNGSGAEFGYSSGSSVTNISDLDEKLNNGTWEGGYVEGMGYVGNQITVSMRTAIDSYCTACQAVEDSGKWGGAVSNGAAGAGYKCLSGWGHIWGWHKAFIKNDTTTITTVTIP